MSQNYETNSVTVVNLVSDLQHSNTVFALWPAWLSLFSESAGADRAGSLVAIALPWLLLFRTTGKGFCLSRPTPPPASLTRPVYSESFSPVQLQFSLPCPNGHHVTFYLARVRVFRSDYRHPQLGWLECIFDVDDTWNVTSFMLEL